jgi:hypothetical protein
MAVESSGHSRGNPRLYELIEHAPKTGPSPTVWAFPQLVEYLKVAAQPVQGPWPPHQQPRPDPEAESMPVAVPDPASFPRPPAAPTAQFAETSAPSLPEFAAAPADEPTWTDAGAAGPDVPAAEAAPAEFSPPEAAPAVGAPEQSEN